MGSCNTPVRPKAAREGPIARRITCFAVEPLTIRPPIRTSSPVPTISRVEMLSWREVCTTDAGSLGSVPERNSERLSSASPSASPSGPPSCGSLIWASDNREAWKLVKSTSGAIPTRVINGIGIPGARIDPDRHRGHIRAGRFARSRDNRPACSRPRSAARGSRRTFRS